jgi:hypothetical protein
LAAVIANNHKHPVSTRFFNRLSRTCYSSHQDHDQDHGQDLDQDLDQDHDQDLDQNLDQTDHKSLSTPSNVFF